MVLIIMYSLEFLNSSLNLKDLKWMLIYLYLIRNDSLRSYNLIHELKKNISVFKYQS